MSTARLAGVGFIILFIMKLTHGAFFFFFFVHSSEGEHAHTQFLQTHPGRWKFSELRELRCLLFSTKRDMEVL